MRDILNSIGFRYANAGLTFIVGVVIARNITVSERGELSYLQAIIDLAIVGFSLGLPKVLLNIAVGSRLYRNVSLAMASLCVLGLAGGASIAGLTALLKPEFSSVAVIVGIVFFVRFMMNIIDVRERSSLNFQRYYKCFGLERLLLILLLLVLVFYGLTLEGILWAMAIAPLCILVMYLLKRPVDWRRPSQRQTRFLLHRLWPTGFYNALAALAALAFVRIDHIVIGEIHGTEMLGYFAIAFMILNLINGLAASLSFVITPKLIARKGRSLNGGRTSTIAVFSLILFLYAIMFGVAPYLIPAVYGVQYAQSSDIFQVLVLLGVPLSLKFLLEIKIVANNDFYFLMIENFLLILLKCLCLAYLFHNDGLSVVAVILVSAGCVVTALPFLALRLRTYGRRWQAEAAVS